MILWGGTEKSAQRMLNTGKITITRTYTGPYPAVLSYIHAVELYEKANIPC